PAFLETLVRTMRSRAQAHSCFCWSSSTLPLIAGSARDNNVLPGRLAAFGPGHDVLVLELGKLHLYPAVLADAFVPRIDVLARELDDVDLRSHRLDEPNDGRNLPLPKRTGPDCPLVVLDNFDLPLAIIATAEKNKSTFPGDPVVGF